MTNPEFPSIDDSAVARFESAWRSGNPCTIAECLPPRDDSNYLATLEELVCIDLEFAWRRRAECTNAEADPATPEPPAPSLDDYLERFSELASCVPRLCVEACYLSHRYGERIDPQSYVEKFGSSVSFPELQRAAVRGAEKSVGQGRQIGRYHVQKEHARGGFGRVWIAHDPKLDRSIAIKELRRVVGNDDQVRERFVTEAKIAALLDHPGVVPVYDLVESENGGPCYAMKLVRGRTFGDLIREKHEHAHGGVFERRLLQNLLAIAQTMAYAHSRGVVHRDLKPDNVVIGDYGETIILDWGLAKRIGDPSRKDGQMDSTSSDQSPVLTQHGQVVGTPLYMSPEQATGGLVDARTDVYAMGVILYVILTGEVPFSGTSSEEVLALVQSGEFARPRAIEKTIPCAFEAICIKAMAARREDRYPSAQAFATDLEGVLADEPISAYRENLMERSARWFRRHRTAALVGFLGMVTLTTTSLVASILIDRQRSRAELAEGVAKQQEQQTAQALRVAETRLYRTQIALAASAHARGNITELRRHLGPCAEDQREWIWRYLFNQAHRESLEITPAQAGSVTGLLATRDASKLIAILGDRKGVHHIDDGRSAGRVSVFDASSGQPLWDLATQHEVYDIELSHDGSVLVTAGGPYRSLVKTVQRNGQTMFLAMDDEPPAADADLAKDTGELCFWGASTGTKLFALTNTHRYIYDVAFDVQGNRMLTVGPRRAIVWNVAGLSAHNRPTIELEHVHTDTAAVSSYEYPSFCGFSADGKTAFLSPGIWNLDQNVFQAANDLPQTHASPFAQVLPMGSARNHPNGELGAMTLYRNEAQKIGVVVKREGLGSALLDGLDETSATVMRFAESSESLLVGTVQGHVLHYRLSTDGEAGEPVKSLQDVRGLPQFVGLVHAGPITGVAFLGDQRIATAGMDNRIRIWHLRDSRVNPRVASFGWAKPEFHACARTPRLLMDRHRVVDTETLTELAPISVPGLQHAAIANHRGRIAVETQLDAKNSKALAIHDAPDQPARVQQPLEHEIELLGWSPDDSLLAVLDEAGELSVRESDTLRRIWSLPDFPVATRMVWSPDSRKLAIIHGDGTSVVDCKSHQVRWSIPQVATKVNDLAWSPDSSRLIGVTADGEIKRWKATDGELVSTSRRHAHAILSLAVSPDGEQIVVGDAKGLLSFFDFDEGVELLSLQAGQTGVVSLSFDCYGNRLFAALDGYLQVYDATPSRNP